MSAVAFIGLMSFRAPSSTNSTEPAFEWLPSVHVAPGCSMQSRTASAAVANEKPMRADFTAPLKRESSSIHRCWYGLSCSTGGRFPLDGGEPEGPLTETVDVVEGELPAFADFLCCVIRCLVCPRNKLVQLSAFQSQALLGDFDSPEARQRQRQISQRLLELGGIAGILCMREDGVVHRVLHALVQLFVARSAELLRDRQ